MKLINANFPFRPESVCDPIVFMYREVCAFAFLITKENNIGQLVDSGWVVFKSSSVTQIKYGYPNDEAQKGHPLFKHGLDEFVISEVFESDWVKDISIINSVNFPPFKLFDVRHHIFLFKESVLEILWDNYTYDFEKDYESAFQACLKYFNDNPK